MKGRVNNLANVRFGKLTALEKMPSVIYGSGTMMTVWRCKCDCGKTKDVLSRYLLRGSVKTCGNCPREVINEERL